MTRFISALTTLLLISGCQSALRNQPRGGSELDERLSAIEQTRLAVATPGNRADEAGDEAASGGFALANRGVLGSVPSADNTKARQMPLTLGEMGADPYAKDSKPAAGSSADDDERAEKYLHKRPLPTLWENVKRDVKDMPHDLWHDTKQVYANPVNLAILGVGVGGSLTLKETGPDDTVEHHYRPGHHTFSEGWRNFFDAYGNPGTHFAIAGAWYLLGEQFQDDKTYNVSKTLASALIINGLTTYVGQAASWDRAPNGSWGTWPSGHTSSSFCIASVMDEAYGHVVGVPMYGLATLVAMERLDDRNHYFSDVVMGGVLGMVVGHSVAAGRDPEFFGWKILPYANPEGGSGVAFFKSMP